MNNKGIQLRELPSLKNPLFIAGFDGWGNALNVSSGMATYLIRRLKGRLFADLDPDCFYRYDENRPLVDIEAGALKSVTLPGGAFYAATTKEDQNDLVILKADEPNLRWFQFGDELFSLCHALKIKTIITLGSMYDNVLHTDRIMSGIASTEEIESRLKEHNVNSISYQGPSAIHSIIQSEGAQKGFNCISLWAHCPYYLQGTTHFGMLIHLCALLSQMGNFQVDTQDLEQGWEKLKEQIQKLIEGNAELQTLINKLRKEKVKGTTASLRGALKSDEKIINLQDFLDPK